MTEASESARRFLAEQVERVRGAALGTSDQPAPQSSRRVPRGAWPGAEGLGAGRLGAPQGSSSSELVERALEGIVRFDDRLRAWVTVDAAGAKASASESDARAARGRRLSALDGMPIGIKDLIDTRGLRTTYGSPLFAGHVPERDAEVVARLRRSGAVILGKTVTTEFATYDPGPTRNPWNEGHTPGGSSSGSAAAVAAGMVPVAIGTQTGGSTIRPASYCGVVGYIPTADWIPRRGIFPCSWTLDRVGLFGRSVADVAVLLDACLGRRPAAQAGRRPSDPRRVAILQPLVLRASQPMRAAVERAAELLAERLEIVSVDVPFLDDLHAAHVVIMWSEIAGVHADRYATSGAAYGPRVAAIVEAGRTVAAVDYLSALRLRRRLLAECRSLLERVDALIAPAAVGEAEATLDTIGEPTMNLFATFSGCPAISVPISLSEAGLPLGVQLIGRRDDDAPLLRLAADLEEGVGFVRPDLPARQVGRGWASD